MYALELPIGSTGLEPRLERRYGKLVMAHLHAMEHLAAGLKALPGVESSFATTQAMWRFLNNEDVTLTALAEPLRAAAQAQAARTRADYLLVMHDWSRLDFAAHTAKADRLQMTHAHDVGYELQSSLLVDAVAGLPIAPLVQNLVSAEGVLSTRGAVAPGQTHLDELSERLAWLEAQELARPLVHIIDREADSAAHLRQWHEWYWLIRARESSTVQHDGTTQKLAAIADTLTYSPAGDAQYKGRTAALYVAEAAVTLVRPARPKRAAAATGRRPAPVKGEPLAMRLIVVRVQARGATRPLAQWTLLANLPATVAPATLACWYYWRWRIESYFKLLKSAGHHVEQWQQHSAPAIARRLLIAAQACVTVWRLNLRQDAQAAEARAFLARLSGRQIKPDRLPAPSALLAGLYRLLTTLMLLEHYPPEQLLRLARDALGLLQGGEDV